jgi:mycofactocin system glycosyltransferase
VRDRAEQLAVTLNSILAHTPESPVVVVDDGSCDAQAVQQVCVEASVRLLRHPTSRGPAAARNTGLAACTTPFVAFVDSDVTVSSRWANQLLGHFEDAQVAAVAPRVIGRDEETGLIAAYESRHSALDMGCRPGRIAPWGAVPYVPAAALMVRVASAGSGFDATLTVGEDVDFVWRLKMAGWTVRYEPSVKVNHAHRVTLRSFLERRRAYAASVAPLARLHPDALPAVRLTTWMALPWLAAATGRNRLSLAAATIATARVSRQLRGVANQPNLLAAGLVARGLLRTGEGLAQAARRSWTVPLLAACTQPRGRRLLFAAYAAPLFRDALTVRDPSALPADLVLRCAEELVAAASTVQSCIQQRVLRPLLPAWGPIASG